MSRIHSLPKKSWLEGLHKHWQRQLNRKAPSSQSDGARRRRRGTILANAKANNTTSFQQKATGKSTLELMGTTRKWDTILPLPPKTFCGFRVRTKRTKKNKHDMKGKPHQEQKIRTERLQISIFMGNFQFDQDSQENRSHSYAMCLKRQVFILFLH